GALAEAGEGGQGHVLLVGGPAGRSAQARPGQEDQPSEVALPELLRRGVVAGLESVQPVRDRARNRHPSPPPVARSPGPSAPPLGSKYHVSAPGAPLFRE